MPFWDVPRGAQHAAWRCMLDHERIFPSFVVQPAASLLQHSWKSHEMQGGRLQHSWLCAPSLPGIQGYLLRLGFADSERVCPFEGSLTGFRLQAVFRNALIF